jgi:hypothetical protein
MQGVIGERSMPPRPREYLGLHTESCVKQLRDVDVDKQYMAMFTLWILTTAAPWDAKQ